MTEVTVKLNKLDIAPRKVRAVIKTVQGLPAGEAEAQLTFRKERSAKPILKLLRSAIANAKTQGLNAEILYIKEVFANKGLRLKRWLPRARGMATPLHKDFSNVTMTLAESENKKSRFQAGTLLAGKTAKKEEKAAKKEVKTTAKPKKVEEKEKASEPKVASQENARKRLFRRKSV